MSITLEVTFSVETAEKLQNSDEILVTLAKVADESWTNLGTVEDVCKCVIKALKKLPYTITPKQGTHDRYDWNDSFGADDQPEDNDHDDENEANDESNEYDSTASADWAEVSDSGWAIRDDEDEKSKNDKETEGEEPEYDDDEEEDATDADGDDESEGYEEDMRGSCGVGSKLDNPDIEEKQEYNYPKQVIVAVDMQNGRTGFHITTYENDTWADLATKLRRLVTLPQSSIVFYFQGLRYEEGQSKLKDCGVKQTSMVTAWIERSQLPQTPWLSTSVRKSVTLPNEYPIFRHNPYILSGMGDNKVISIFFRDLMNLSLEIPTTSGASLYDLTKLYEDQMPFNSSPLVYRLPSGVVYTSQSLGMNFNLQDLGLQDGSVVIVMPRSGSAMLS